MEKRYQVFVSSTYADLREERNSVIQTLMEMDCIPAGMELFPAMDEDQFDFIKKVIDDCDYYLLIIGGRYGSITSEGISYTEKEFDYAVKKDIKVLAFLHEDPEQIPVGKTEKSPELVERLNAFRDKAAKSRLIKKWNTAKELPGLVSLSLTKTIKKYPALGWVRGNVTNSTELLEEINKLRKANDELRAQLQFLPSQSSKVVLNLEEVDTPFEICGTYKSNWDDTKRNWDSNQSFAEYFSLIAPYLLEHPNDSFIQIKLAEAVLNSKGTKVYEAKTDDLPYQTLRLQLKALGFINLTLSQTSKGGMALFWSLTQAGEIAMLRLRTVQKKS